MSRGFIIKNYLSMWKLIYYNKLGILIPVFVNKYTGDIYYFKNQLIILDLILIYTYMVIPLKNFNNFILNNRIYDAEKMLIQ